MEAIRSATIAPAVPVTQALRSFATISVAACGAALMLLIAKSFSDTVVRIAAGEAVSWAHFVAQFAIPSLPMLLSLMLYGARARASASVAGLGGAALYLLLWVTIAY